jgi:hypothetical protein
MTPGTKQVYVAILVNGDQVIDDSDITVEVKASGVGAGETAEPVTPQPVPEATNGANNTETPNNGEKPKDLVEGLKKNTYLGIFFLLPALAFSLVISGFKDDRPIWQRTTSAESLKEIFYAQCYYFAPISLFTFVMLYSFLFSTVKVRGTSFLALFAFLGMWFWFYQAEVTAVLQERKSKNKLVAHLIVLSTIIVLVIASWNILLIDPEALRLRAYELLKYGIYFVFFYQLILRRIINWWKNRRNKKAGVPPSNKKAGVSPSLVDRLPKSGIQN